jgi:hypothetical protein
LRQFRPARLAISRQSKKAVGHRNGVDFQIGRDARAGFTMAEVQGYLNLKGQVSLPPKIVRSVGIRS